MVVVVLGMMPAVASGAGWAIQRAPNPPGSTEVDVYGVSCGSPRACTAVGTYRDQADSFPALAEIWNGRSWTIHPTPTVGTTGDDQLSGVSCVLASACTAVGNADGRVTLAEAWNGSSWAVQPTPDIPGSTGGNGLSGVSCVSAGACTAVGAQFQNFRGTLAEAWNGSSWVIQPTPDPPGATFSQLSGVSCVSASACTAVGLQQQNSARALTEARNGSSWVIQPTPDPPGATFSQLSGVSCVSASACTAVGVYGNRANDSLTLAEVWNGKRWAIQPTPNPPGAIVSQLFGVSCVSAHACTAVGHYVNRAYDSLTLAEAWNGKRWAIQPTPNPPGPKPPGVRQTDLNAVSCVSAGACTAVGTGENPVGDVLTLVEGYTPTPVRSHCAQRATSACGAAILGGTAFVSPSGVAGVFLGCFDPRPCRGSMTVSHRGSVIAHRDAYTIGAEDGGIVHLSLSRAARGSLADGHLTPTVQIADASGLVRSAPVTLVAFGDTTLTARAADAGASRIAIFGRTGFVSPSGIVEVFLGCFGSQDCTGAITLTAGRAIIASYRGRLVGADNGALAHVPLNAHGRKLVTGRTTKAKVTVKDTGGSSAAAELTLEHSR
jgi:hypothetical protein